MKIEQALNEKEAKEALDELKRQVNDNEGNLLLIYFSSSLPLILEKYISFSIIPTLQNLMKQRCEFQRTNAEGET